MLSAMLLPPQTPPRSSRMSWRSSMGMVSSRGTTLNRYSLSHPAFPTACSATPAQQMLLGDPSSLVISPIISYPIPPFPYYPTPCHSTHSTASHPILSHPIPSLLPSHPISSHSVPSEHFWHFLARQEQRSDLLSLTPCTSHKAVYFAVANLGTWAGPIACHTHLEKAGVVCSK